VQRSVLSLVNIIDGSNLRSYSRKDASSPIVNYVGFLGMALLRNFIMNNHRTIF
jgi:hypothetical protein